MQWLSDFLNWLHQTNNLDILKTFGSFAVAVCGGAVFIWDRFRKNEGVRRAIPPVVPASQRPQNKPRRPVRQSNVRGACPIWLWQQSRPVCRMGFLAT
jgi:hypothetical protein